MNECEHIDGICIKRHFKYLDLETGKYISLSICNEKIKLLYHESINKYKGISNSNIIQNILEDIVLESANSWFWLPHIGVNNNDFNKYTIPVVVCDRPFIFTHVRLFQIIDFYLKNRSYLLRDIIISELDKYHEKIKDIKKYNKLKELLKKHYLYTSIALEIQFNDVLIQLLNNHI